MTPQAVYLWKDLEDDDEDDEKKEADQEQQFENAEEDDKFGDEDTFMVCLQCGSPVEDGEQCPICGYIGE